MLRAARLATAACLIAGLTAGCDTWPSYGRGGLAEVRPLPLRGQAAALSDQAQCIRKRRAELAARGEDLSLGLAQNFDLLAARISRELAGDLVKDAANDLATLDQMVGRPHNSAGQTDAKECKA
jgi:hypothetical protein